MEEKHGRVMWSKEFQAKKVGEWKSRGYFKSLYLQWIRDQLMAASKGLNLLWLVTEEMRANPQPSKPDLRKPQINVQKDYDFLFKSVHYHGSDK